MVVLSADDVREKSSRLQSNTGEDVSRSLIECDFATLAQDLGEEPPRNKSPTLVCVISKPLYSIQPIPGKDLGMVAAASIKRGQPIFSEAPLIYCSYHHSNKDTMLQFHRLSTEKKRQILELRNIRQKEKGPIFGVIWTNAITLRGTQDAALFATASRINHSCLPNTHAAWDATSGSLTVYATRDIRAGQEITSTYLKSPSCYSERQEYLAERLSFNCQCDLCSLDLVARWVSDDRITMIRSLKKEIKAKFNAHSREPRTITLVRRLLRLYEQESVVDWRPAEAYWFATGFCILRGDLQRAAVFAGRGASLYKAVEGMNSPMASKLRKVAVTGEAFSSCSVKPCQTSMSKEGSQGYEDWLFGEKKDEQWCLG